MPFEAFIYFNTRNKHKNFDNIHSLIFCDHLNFEI